MKKINALLITAMTLWACNNEKSRIGAWTVNDKQKWMDQCLPQMKGILQEDVGRKYCMCILEQMEQKYTGYHEADRKGTEAEGRELGKNCIHLIQGGTVPDEETGSGSTGSVLGRWTEEDKEKWMQQCKTEMGNLVDAIKTNNYCRCILDQLEKRYPNFNEMNIKGTVQEGEELGKNCTQHLLGN